MCNRQDLEKPSFGGEVDRQGFSKEMVFSPSLKNCIGIRPLKNDSAGVLDRGNARMKSMGYVGYSENYK